MDVPCWPSPPAPRWVDVSITTPQRERSLRKRRDILLAAAHAIDRAGYRGATLQDISAGLGASNGGLYHHFESKHALAEALVCEVLASWEDILIRIDQLDLDPLSTLLVRYDAFCARLTHDPTVRAATRVMQDDIARTQGRRWLAAWQGGVENIFRRARTEGSLEIEIDPARLSRLIVAAATGHGQLAQANPTGPSMWQRMDDTWSGLLPAVATAPWLERWSASGWSGRSEPDHRYRLGSDTER